jgi:hypothetical protein
MCGPAWPSVSRHTLICTPGGIRKHMVQSCSSENKFGCAEAAQQPPAPTTQTGWCQQGVYMQVASPCCRRRAHFRRMSLGQTGRMLDTRTHHSCLHTFVRLAPYALPRPATGTRACACLPFPLYAPDRPRQHHLFQTHSCLCPCSKHAVSRHACPDMCVTPSS